MANRVPAFALLAEQRRPPMAAFATSFAVQAMAVAMLLLVATLFPETIVPRNMTAYTVTMLTPAAEPTPTPPPPMVTRRHLTPPPVLVEAPKLVMLDRPPVPRVKTSEVAPRVELPKPELASLVLPSVVTRPSQIIHTGSFSGDSQKVATTSLPARAVQTGGFGDPNGFKGDAKPGAHANVARLGSFDLPPGPGYGNGTGGAQGARGRVASAAFGSGKSIQQGGFGDVRQAPEARLVRAAATPASFTPVQVLAKPNPVYTDEARRLKIEGEVLLEVDFPAAGECRVLRVLRGLGYGLDEAAARAAQQIRFTPATRDGQPVDSTATLHVLFQLAY